MSYFVTCTFDIKNGTADDYRNAYADLSKLGLRTKLTGDKGTTITLPTTTTAGEFTGTTATSVRNDVIESVKKAFSIRHFTSEIFVSVGGDWAWGHRTT